MPVLKVGIKLVRIDSWKNDLAQVFDNGWIGGDFDGTSQEFISTKTGNIDLDLEFQGHGTFRIDYYENSKTVTKSKVFSW
jgi:hypothetical protein